MGAAPGLDVFCAIQLEEDTFRVEQRKPHVRIGDKRKHLKKEAIGIAICPDGIPFCLFKLLWRQTRQCVQIRLHSHRSALGPSGGQERRQPVLCPSGVQLVPKLPPVVLCQHGYHSL